MDRKQFDKRLGRALRGLCERDKSETLAYYHELIEDHMEHGKSEAEAIAAVGSPESIAAGILDEMPAGKKARAGMNIWIVLLLVLGSPVWLSLALALAAVVLSLYVSLWAVAAALFACSAGTAGGAIGGIACAVLFAIRGFVPAGIAFCGASFVCAGCSILFWHSGILSAKGMIAAVKVLPARLRRKEHRA